MADKLEFCYVHAIRKPCGDCLTAELAALRAKVEEATTYLRSGRNSIRQLLAILSAEPETLQEEGETHD
jgi:hypothetical protein